MGFSVLSAQPFISISIKILAGNYSRKMWPAVGRFGGSYRGDCGARTVLIQNIGLPLGGAKLLFGIQPPKPLSVSLETQLNISQGVPLLS